MALKEERFSKAVCKHTTCGHEDIQKPPSRKPRKSEGNAFKFTWCSLKQKDRDVLLSRMHDGK